MFLSLKRISDVEGFVTKPGKCFTLSQPFQQQNNFQIPSYSFHVNILPIQCLQNGQDKEFTICMPMIPGLSLTSTSPWTTLDLIIQFPTQHFYWMSKRRLKLNMQNRTPDLHTPSLPFRQPSPLQLMTSLIFQVLMGKPLRHPCCLSFWFPRGQKHFHSDFKIYQTPSELTRVRPLLTTLLLQLRSKLKISVLPGFLPLLLSWASCFHPQFFLWVELCPKKRYVVVQTSVFVKVTLFGYKVFANINNLRWGQIGVGPNLMTGVLMREWFRDTEIKGKMPCGDGGRDWRYATTSQGTPRNALKDQKLEEARKDSPPELLEGAWPCWHLDFKRLVSKHG